MEDSSKLDTNITGSNNGNTLGLVLQIEESITVNAQFGAGNLRNNRITTFMNIIGDKQRSC